MKTPRVRPDTVAILAGICAAIHVGKLPPALPVLRDAFGMTLVEAGLLLSLVQFAAQMPARMATVSGLTRGVFTERT